jgi:hypothetical protein|tara:strand:- start:8255 stop:9124 length:870 start_codon:yes stop_codon:yes gene_type:complete
MKAQFDQNLLSSFYLWLERRLLASKAEAYSINMDNAFQYVDFPDIPSSHVGYQGKFRQLVADHGVNQQNSGFFEDGGFVTGDYDENGGVYTDYNNGRLIFPAASGTSMDLTANSTVKEVNTYISNDSDLQMILQSDFKDGSLPYQYQQTSELDEDIYFLPACFISIASSDNEPFSFGGEDNTESRIRVMLLSFDNYILDGVLSLLRDTVREDMTHIPYEDFPYGFSFSIKNFPYSYEDLVDAQSSPMISHIQKVSVSKVVSEELREKLNKNISIAFIDFDLTTYRFPRL